MLFILTGCIQTGKTRWLQALTKSLRENGVSSYGVLAPGVWREHPEAQTTQERFEKLGINNVLLPQNTVIPFARRKDLALSEGSYSTSSQSAQAQLGWEISDQAIAQVNAHFCSFCPKLPSCEAPVITAAPGQDAAATVAACISAAAPAPQSTPGLLIVDELGPLELLNNCGLTCALDILEQGPNPMFKHALIVVRETLLDAALQRFENTWGEVCHIAPTDEARAELLGLYL